MFCAKKVTKLPDFTVLLKESRGNYPYILKILTKNKYLRYCPQSLSQDKWCKEEKKNRGTGQVVLVSECTWGPLLTNLLPHTLLEEGKMKGRRRKWTSRAK